MIFTRGEAMPEMAIQPFERGELIAYAAASGDDNPLHLDADLAKKAGFSAPPVHGMLLMALIEPALYSWRPLLKMVRLKAQFVEPLLIGQSARLLARVVKAMEREALLRIAIQGPARAPCLVGEAHVQIEEPKAGARG